MFTDTGRRKAARSRRGKHLSAATKKKISRSLKGKRHPHKGHKQSKATRAKISKALKGKKHPHKGHPIGQKQMAAMQAGLRAYWERRRAMLGNGSTKTTMGRGPMRRRRPISAIRGSLTNVDVLDIKEHRIIRGSRRLSNHKMAMRKRVRSHH